MQQSKKSRFLYQTAFVKIKKNRWFQIGGLMFGGSWDLGAPLGFEIGREKIEPRTTREIRREFSKAKFSKIQKRKQREKYWYEENLKRRCASILHFSRLFAPKVSHFDLIFYFLKLVFRKLLSSFIASTLKLVYE